MTWKDRLYDAGLDQFWTTTFEQLVHDGVSPDDAITEVLRRRELADTNPLCGYCGTLAWTVRNYGRVTHKEGCPNRTDPWHQGNPHPEKE